MQDRYVGDVGDYGKYALLRALVKDTDLVKCLAVIWCRFDNESHNGDGGHTSYLKNSAYAALDPRLYQSLQKIVAEGNRFISAIESADIFPPGTIYFGQPATGCSGDGLLGQQRQLYRTEWLSRALSATSDADIVFFDPDNGIGTPGTARFGAKGGKFIYWNELQHFWRRGQSLVIYHHLNRTASVAAQTAILRELFEHHFDSPPILRPLLFRRGSCRHFWIVGQHHHMQAFNASLNKLSASDWRMHWDF